MCLKCGFICCIATCILIYIGYISKPGSSIFSFHPFCMTTAFVGLLTYSITVLCSKRKLPLRKSRQLHWMFNVSAGIMAAIGFSCIYYNKYVASREHFTSWHGTIGAATCLLLLSQLLSGLPRLYSGYFRRFLNSRLVLLMHRWMALLVYTMGLATMSLAFYSTWFANSHTQGFISTLIAVNIMLLFYIYRQVLRRKNVKY